jgi:hypothetical protein
VTAADILRAAADLVEADADAWLLKAIDDAATEAATPDQTREALFEAAIYALALYLRYDTSRMPSKALARWSTIRSREDMVREMRSAADATGRGTCG